MYTQNRSIPQRGLYYTKKIISPSTACERSSRRRRARSTSSARQDRAAAGAAGITSAGRSGVGPGSDGGSRRCRLYSQPASAACGGDARQRLVCRSCAARRRARAETGAASAGRSGASPGAAAADQPAHGGDRGRRHRGLPLLLREQGDGERRREVLDPRRANSQARHAPRSHNGDPARAAFPVYNATLRLLDGPFAAGEAGSSLEPLAFDGKFQTHVRFDRRPGNIGTNWSGDRLTAGALDVNTTQSLLATLAPERPRAPQPAQGGHGARGGRAARGVARGGTRGVSGAPVVPPPPPPRRPPLVPSQAYATAAAKPLHHRSKTPLLQFPTRILLVLLLLLVRLCLCMCMCLRLHLYPLPRAHRDGAMRTWTTRRAKGCVLYSDPGQRILYRSRHFYVIYAHFT